MARNKKLTKKQKKQRIQITLTTLLVGVAFLMGLFFGDNPYNTGYFLNKWQAVTNELTKTFSILNQESSSESSNVSEGTVRFFDVGQGSATLMQASDGTNILIDTGRYDDSNQRILGYLDQYIGTGGTIDLLIFTHNDADHIGNGDLILDYYQVEEVWMNGVDHTTKVYEDVLDAISESNALYYEPKAQEIKNVGPFRIEVLNPSKTDVTDDQNEESIVTRTTLNETSIMISGDVSSDVERRLIKQNQVLNSDIVLIGHHGSRDSSSSEWLSATDPRVGIVQAGKDNTYGHPHKETLLRIKNQGIPLYNSVDNGTITVNIDETDELDIQTEKE